MPRFFALRPYRNCPRYGVYAATHPLGTMSFLISDISFVPDELYGLTNASMFGRFVRGDVSQTSRVAILLLLKAKSATLEFAGSVSVLSFDPLKASLPMYTPGDPEANVSLPSFAVFLNVLTPISVTEAGTVIDVTFLHPLNAPCSAATGLPSTVEGTDTAPEADFEYAEITAFPSDRT